MISLLPFIIGILVFISLQFLERSQHGPNRKRNIAIGLAFAGAFFLFTYIKSEDDEIREHKTIQDEQNKRRFEEILNKDNVNQVEEKARETARKQVIQDSILRSKLKKKSF